LLEPTPEPSKKEKRKSFTGFASGLWKPKAATKEPSPEPTKDATESSAPAEAAAAEAASAPAEATTQPEEASLASPEAKPEKSKRGSFFGGLRSKKETKATSPALTNGETAETSKSTEPAPTTSETPATTEETPATTAPAETKPETPRKESLGRRLTSQFKSLGRSKSPEKAQAAKVSDEAPKIDTPIESTAEPTTSDVPATEAKPEEPLSTTEAPTTAAANAPTTAEPTPAPVVSTQA